MADIRPFNGVHYNQPLVKNLAAVLCPPYDVITPQMQHELYQRSDYNFVRIEFGRELPEDKETDNRYTRAAATLGKWLEQGILQKDSSPSFYIDDHSFTCQGKSYRRRSINCLVRLEDWDKMIVRPHEGTLSNPKGDRLNLLWKLQANTSPIMGLYEDGDGKISSLLKEQTSGNPLLSNLDVNGDSHQLRAITDIGAIENIRDCFAGHPLYIADGHHRYESALAFRRERRAFDKSASGNEPYDFVMMTLVDFADPGLVILPAHRLIRGISPTALDGLFSALKECFIVKELPLNEDHALERINDLLVEKPGEIRLVLYGLKERMLISLILRDFSLVRPMFPAFHSELYRTLDVSIIDHVILEELIGLTHDKTGVFIDYTNDALKAIKRVAEQEYQLALLVNPVKPGVIKTIADSGDRMPKKSTYFYPKIPAGLIFYRFA